MKITITNEMREDEGGREPEPVWTEVPCAE